MQGSFAMMRNQVKLIAKLRWLARALQSMQGPAPLRHSQLLFHPTPHHLTPPLPSPPLPSLSPRVALHYHAVTCQLPSPITTPSNSPRTLKSNPCFRTPSRVSGVVDRTSVGLPLYLALPIEINLSSAFDRRILQQTIIIISNGR